MTSFQRVQVPLRIAECKGRSTSGSMPEVDLPSQPVLIVWGTWLNTSLYSADKIIEIHEQWMTFARTWHLFDAKWQNPFESALVVKQRLCGLHKPIYHPMNDCGDHVVVINCREIALPGDEWRRRVYFHHTGYPGGASWTPAWELHEKNPTMVMWKAVYNSMRGNLKRRYTMCRLHLFADDATEDVMSKVTSQIRQIRPVPQRLDYYPEEYVTAFPKLLDWPKDYVLPVPKEQPGAKGNKRIKSSE